MQTVKLKAIPEVGSEIGINDTIVYVESVNPAVPSMVVSDYFQSVPNATTYIIEIE